MNDLTTTDRDNKAQELVRAAALAWHQPERMDELAQLCDVDEMVLAQLLTDPSTLPTVMRELARMRRSGELLAELAAPALEKFIKRSEQAMDDPDIGMAVLSKTADTVLKLSGLAEARSVASRQASVAPTSFIGFYTTGPGDPEPPPVRPGELRCHIHYAGPSAEKTVRPVAGKVIEQEVVSEQ